MPYLYTDTASPAPTPLDEAAKLRRALRRAMVKLYTAHPAGSLTSLMILLSLPHQGKGSLADKLGLNRATIKSQLQLLTTWGYVRIHCRQRNTDSSLITLTPAGEDLFRL